VTDANVIKNDTVRHPRLFTSGDRLDPVKLMTTIARQVIDAIPAKERGRTAYQELTDRIIA
jgi:hypothetical protein